MKILRQRLTSSLSLLKMLALALLALGFSGCGSNKANELLAANNDTNIKRLGSLYGFFHLKNQFRGPKNEDEFKKFISEQQPSRLALVGVSVSKLDELFVSERDKQAFSIRYGVDTKLRGAALPVIFEAKGVEGKRQVAFTNGHMQEVDPTQYEELRSGKVDQPAPAPAATKRGKR